MTYWPWWLGGVGLALAAVLHFVLTRRLLAVSGRFSTLVDRARHGEAPDDPELSHDDLLAALRAATAEQFGASASTPEPPAEPAPEPLPTAAPNDAGTSLVFFGGVALGACASAWLAGALHPEVGIGSPLFASLVGGTGRQAVVLTLGGVLVGFGTRMAGGCTSGHGLVGVSRLQKGSLLATLAFFGAGVLASLLIARFV